MSWRTRERIADWLIAAVLLAFAGIFTGYVSAQLELARQEHSARGER